MFYNICSGWTSITWSWNICNIKLNNWAAYESNDGVRVKSGISHVQCLIPMCLIIKSNFWWRHGLSTLLDFYQFDLFDLFFNESLQPKASGPLAVYWSSASSAAANELWIWTVMHQCIILKYTRGSGVGQLSTMKKTLMAEAWMFSIPRIRKSNVVHR